MSPHAGSRAVLYVRVSTAQQAGEGHSLDAQRDRLAEYATAHGLHVVELIEDGGESGADLDRPGFARVLELVAAGAVDVLIATKADRIARSLRDLLNLVAELDRHGVAITLADEDFDTATPAGELTVQIRGAVAQYERALIRQRTREGLAAAKRKGIRLGKPPVGFTVTGGELAPRADDPRYLLGLRALAMRDEGATLQQIADTFTAEGITSPLGRPYLPTTVRTLLKGHMELRNLPTSPTTPR